MTTVPSGQYRQSVSLSPKYRLALRLKNGKPHQSPSAQNRKIGSDCSFHASELLENCSFSDRAGTRIALPFISNLLLLFLWLGSLPSQLGLQSSIFLGQVEKLPRGKPLAWSADGIPQSYLAISKDMHGPPCARHRDVQLCFVRLAERPNRHAGNDLVDSLRLAGVTGDSYSLVKMQSGPIANNLAFIEYDLAMINADHRPELVIEELLPAVFDVFRESDPVADCQRDLLSLEHTELPCLVERQLLLGAVLSDDDSSLLPAKHFPLFAALKSLFLDSFADNSLGHPVKLDDLPWLIGDCITLLGISQVQSLKPRNGMLRV